MKISIAMTTYNGAAYVQAQLDSFARQTRLPDELVITDDGSTDATPDIVRAFAQAAPFAVRYEINPKNLGFAQNFSRAMSLCTGDLIFLSDQDDVWFEDKLRTMSDLALAEPGRACFMNDAVLADGSLNTQGHTKLGQIRAAGLADSTFVMGCCVLAKRALADIALPVPPGLPSHDNWLVQLADVLDLTLRIETPLQYYRLHGRNVSDFFVNRVERPRPLDRLKARVLRLRKQRRSSTNLDKERLFLDAIATRLAERRAQCATLVGAAVATRAEAAVGRRLEVLTRRGAIRNLPAPARPTAVFQLWRDGGYRVSGGRSGMLKDIMAARSAPFA